MCGLTSVHEAPVYSMSQSDGWVSAAVSGEEGRHEPREVVGLSSCSSLICSILV